MAKQAFLCKYAEIGIKGKNRYKFENALCEQIRRRLAKIDGEFTVVREQGRIFVEADGDYDFEDAKANTAQYVEDFFEAVTNGSADAADSSRFLTE